MSHLRGTDVTLKSVLESDVEGYLGKGAEQPTLGVLTKLIDSAERLTLQVHPDKPTALRLFQSQYATFPSGRSKRLGCPDGGLPAAEYILPTSVVVLLVMDLYIHFVHSVNVDFINAAGLFREDRDNEIIAAVLNITLSILGAKTIGLAGVLLGTVVSQMWFWFGRSYVVFKLCLQADKEDYLKYWLKNIVDGVALTVSIVFCAYLNSRLPIANGYLKFVCSGILCEAVSVALFGVFHFGDPEVRKMLKYLVNHIGKR